MNQRGFTLTELLTVIAIMAILAALLFPVLSEAKASAKRVACLENFHQIQSASTLYLNDYDDRFMPISYDPGRDSNSRTDRTWVQLLLPYASSFSSFICPGASNGGYNYDASFDQDLVPGDLFSRYYSSSLHVNAGLNYMALSPSVALNNRWVAMPREYEEVVNPSSTIMMVDSAWAVSSNGQPYGGGNWLVEPPCRYESVQNTLIDLFAADGYSFNKILSYGQGWTGFGTGTRPYGGAWPWHSGKMNVVRVDGSAETISPAQLSKGCNVLRRWGGSVLQGSSYNWSPIVRD